MSKLKHWLRRWHGLAPWERRVLARLAWRLPVVWVLLRVFGFQRTHHFIEAKSSPSLTKYIPEESTPGDYAQRCAQLTEIAACHGLYEANCLHQSLALCSFLRHIGLQAQLRIGVLPGSEPLQAHAWVELDGRTLGKSVTEYQAFPALDACNGLTSGFKS